MIFPSDFQDKMNLAMYLFHNRVTFTGADFFDINLLTFRGVSVPVVHSSFCDKSIVGDRLFFYGYSFSWSLYTSLSSSLYRTVETVFERRQRRW